MNYRTGKFQKTNRDSRQLVQGQATVFCTPLGGKDVGNEIMKRDSLRHIVKRKVLNFHQVMKSLVHNYTPMISKCLFLKLVNCVLVVDI